MNNLKTRNSKTKWALFLLVFLSVFTLLVATPEKVFADDFQLVFDSNTKTITGFEGTPPDRVVIPYKIDGVTVEKIKSGLFYNEDISYLEIPKTVKILKSDGNTTSGDLTKSKVYDCYLANKNTMVFCYYGEKYGDYYFDKATQTIVYYTNRETSDLVIPASFDGVKVKVIGEEAFRNLSLYNVEVPEGVVTIEREAFAFNWLQSVKLPSTLETIGEGAFSTNDLYDVTLPNNLKTIGKESFAYNEIYTLNLGGVSVLGEGAFRANWLQTVTIPASVTEIQKDCFIENEITKVKFSANKNLKTIGTHAFYNNRIQELALPEGLETVGYGAFGYNEIHTVTFPSTLKTIKSYAFEGNPIQYIEIPPSCTKIGEGAFKNNDEYLRGDIGTSLQYIIVNDTDKTVPANQENFDKYNVFDDSYGIIIHEGQKYGDFYFDKTTGTVTGYTGNDYDVVIPNEIDGTTVTAIGDMAFTNKALETVVIPDTVTSIGYGAFSYCYLTSVTLPSNLETISDSAFEYNLLTEITIPSSVKTVGNFAFDSNVLESVVIQEGVEEIGAWAFSSNEITSVVLPNNLKVIGRGAFNGNMIQRVEVPSTVTDTLVISDDPNSYDFIKKPIENGQMETVFLKNYVFDENTEIVVYDGYKYGDFYVDLETGAVLEYSPLGPKVVEIPSEVNGVTITKIGDSAFENLGITSVVLPETITEIGINAFKGNGLTEIYLPENITTIGRGAFSDNKITAVELPKNLTEVSDNCFANNSIETVTIPNSVTYIGRGAFENNKLSEIIIPNNVTQIGTRAFYNNNLRTVKIPDGVVEIVGYVGDNADGSYEKELYPMDEEQLVNLKVFDEDVDIEFKNNINFVAIGIGLGVVVAIVIAGCVVYFNKKKHTSTRNNDVHDNGYVEVDDVVESHVIKEDIKVDVEEGFLEDIFEEDNLENTRIMEPINKDK